MSSEPTKILLTEDEMPRQWYNIQADLPSPLPPPLGPDGTPIGPDALAKVFPMNLIEQEVSTERWIDIPDEVQSILKLWRPSPLYRAKRLEAALGTPAKIYYKNEGVSPAGSHKPNTAVAQAWYNKQFGIKHLITETGAGQWGSALAMSCKLIGIDCKVFMVRISFDQKPFRKIMMRTWGADCIASPSNQTAIGRKILSEMPDTPGSLAIAISEAIEQAVERDDTRYALGSVLNHVMLHQTIIGLEARKQLEKVHLYPDIVIGCAGGGSNFAGISFPFICDKIHGKEVQIIATEPEACPTLTRGPYIYDSGDVAKMTPLLPMHSLGHGFIPPAIHAGGLRYHGMAPLVSHVKQLGLIDATSIGQTECYEAALLFAHTEGFIPAPETSHAIAQTIREAKKAKEEGKEKVILMNWSGHGLMDLQGYEAFLSGKLSDYPLPEELLQRSLASVKNHPAAPQM
ncbi:TrpB-like pyridoxal phosphate-dependent enzyme [Chlorobium sp. BLA1]|uniref:TrpB-like pyridoxal phosphate-dependent enzyme n=1 Tax=Candidatus Chlorobium masyuteum TaxID=2716876 RepID=UPI00141F35B5|nr:TrpB-like pyridoxal phosphate-dependent enzyme [Candidatus Chlorobium masyuteum]NHQ59873.1 TrpB-like pyridoxal phosphate-dependent enzyme [Candidatus Chlorobium masyuteum]NTU44721.1 TrpB-like pyridoxal phosphate-dependent enzyme [Chlorobiaceae bacterium]